MTPQSATPVIPETVVYCGYTHAQDTYFDLIFYFSGGGKAAMKAANRRLRAELLAIFEGSIETPWAGTTELHATLRAHLDGTPIGDTRATVAGIEQAAISAGLPLRASALVNSIVAREAPLPFGDVSSSEYRSGQFNGFAVDPAAFPAHFAKLRELWAPLFDHFLAGARRTGVTDPGAIVALHFELPMLETILAMRITEQTSSWRDEVYIGRYIKDFGAGAGAAGLANLEGQGFIAGLGSWKTSWRGPEPDSIEVRRGKRTMRVPKDWVMGIL